MNANLNTTTNDTTTTTNEALLKCAYCGDTHPESEMSQLGPNDEYFCSDCIDEMVICEDCGDVHHVEEMFLVHADDGSDDGYYVCEDCFDTNYTRCAECGEYIHRENAERIDGYAYCQPCYEELFTECPECGAIVRREDLVYSDCLDDYVCEECAANRSVILSYHSDDRPELNFLHTTCEFPNPLYFGVELEIDGGGENGDKAQTILNELGTNHAHAEHDGSLNEGFELVSQPFTMRYFNQTLSECYASAMATAAKLGYRSHDTTTCGLHIHVGRQGLGNTADERDETITKLWILMYRFRSQLVALSRRELSKLDRWAKLPSLEDLGEMDFQDVRNTDLPDIKLKLKQRGASNRYRALNLTNEDTIEFRLFRGTLKHSTLTATLQLVHNLCALAMTMSGQDALTVTWDQLQTLLCVDAPELAAYMEARL